MGNPRGVAGCSREVGMTPKMTIMINGTISGIWSGRYDKCRGCGAQIGWAKTEKGKWMPFDPDEHVTSHWASCPKAKQFKKATNA